MAVKTLLEVFDAEVRIYQKRKKAAELTAAATNGSEPRSSKPISQVLDS